MEINQVGFSIFRYLKDKKAVREKERVRERKREKRKRQTETERCSSLFFSPQNVHGRQRLDRLKPGAKKLL